MITPAAGLANKYIFDDLLLGTSNFNFKNKTQYGDKLASLYRLNYIYTRSLKTFMKYLES